MTELIDHSALAESRIATQYQASEKFRAYIRALMAQSQDLEAVLHQIAEQRDIDQAEGVSLDIVGEIVGVSRIIDNVLIASFFGFSGQPQATTFGEEGDPGIGARFREEDEDGSGVSVLLDPEYQLLIRAKIARNHSKGTGDDMLQAMSYLFDGVPTGIYDGGGMRITIAIGRPITATEFALITSLDILPRPAGVRIDGLVTYFGDQYFGFDGQPGALGFSEEVIDGTVLDGDVVLDGTFTLSIDGRTYIGGGKFAEETSI